MIFFKQYTYIMDEIISYKMCAVKVRNAKLRNYLNCVYPNPPCQLYLWEETGATGENQRISAEH
jgi:hypothetical protein